MHRHLLITLLLSVFIALLGIGIIVPVMPIFAKSLGAGGLALGIIIAAFSLTRGFCQPIVGNLSDRWGRKGFLISGLFVYGMVGLLMPEAESIASLIMIRALHGVGSAMIVPVAMAYMADLSPVGHEGRAMGLLNIAMFSGIGCGPLIGGFCSDRWGMASAFYIMAGLSCLAMLLIILQIPAVAHDAAKTKKRPGLIPSLRSMLARRRTAGILLTRMATMIIMVPTMAFLPLLMDQWFQATGTQIGIVIATRTLVNATLQHPCGRLADRVNKIHFLRLGCVIIGVVMCLVPLAGSFRTLLGLFVILGAGEAVIWPTLAALATEEGRQYGQGTMMGVFNLSMSAGVFCGAIGAGVISDRLGLSWTFPLIGLLVLSLSLFATTLIHHQPSILMTKNKSETKIP